MKILDLYFHDAPMELNSYDIPMIFSWHSSDLLGLLLPCGNGRIGDSNAGWDESVCLIKHISGIPTNLPGPNWIRRGGDQEESECQQPETRNRTCIPRHRPWIKLLCLDEDFEQYLTFDDTSVLYERIKLRVSLTKKLEGKNSLKFSLSLI